MNQELIDGLNRRFKVIENSKYSENHSIAFLDYFYFIINSPLLLSVCKGVLETGYYLNDEILVYILIASQENNNYSLLSVKTKRVKRFLKDTVVGYEKEKNIKLTDEEIKKLENQQKEKMQELEKETTLNILAIFQNKMIDNLNGAKPKISLVFSRVRGICLSSDINKCYKPRGASNRLDYLERLIRKNGEPVSAKFLAKGLENGVNSRVVVSNELKNINKIIKTKLSLKKEVILGKDGYKLNIVDYEFL